MKSRLPLVLTLLSLLLGRAPLPAQDSNVLLPSDSIESLLRRHPFEVMDRAGSRFEGDRTDRVVLTFADGSPMMVKWARSARGGEAFNNQPRYEVAAYELQKLFLDPSEYVVPPTVMRTFPLAWYRELDPNALPTFDRTGSVLVVLQYWLFNVSSRDVFDEERLQSDSAYARQLGNLNLLTYLIRHSDANQGNILISLDSARPRLFAVDNGVAFASQESDRGVEWRSLRVRRVPQAAVERLRALSLEELQRRLGVLAQWEVRGDELIPVEPGENLSPNRGVRRRDDQVQIGLTAGEIRGVYARLERLLRRVDGGAIQTF